MAAPPPPSRPDSPAALPYDLVEEILLRLPPDDPACLLRASFACKTWSHTVSSPHFRRRFIGLHRHRALPLLGFLHNWEDERVPRFLSTTASSFSLPAPGLTSWLALDCRHGRALFLSNSKVSGAQQLLVWDLRTGIERRVPVPPLFKDGYRYRTASVFCPADGCDHRDCRGDPFRVVFVFTVPIYHQLRCPGLTLACVYSSETRAWGELTTQMYHRSCLIFTSHSSVLVGGSLLYFMSDSGWILEYDLASHDLTGFNPPHDGPEQTFNIMVSADGGIGVSEAFGSQLKLWSREESDGIDSQWVLWVLSRVIHLENLLPDAALVDAETRVTVLGFAEGVNVIFVNSVAGLFTIELQSEWVKKVCDDRGFCNLIPVVSFYTPVDRGECQDLLPPIPSEEVGDEEGEEEEKTVDEAQQLLDKEGGFVNTFECVNHDLNIRSASSEESVTATSNEDYDAEESKTSASNGEDAAPSSDKGDSEEVLC
ncbi:hypothetical protein D1007_50226 [Hordeum vulgare]|uniref:uncharacterized protein LOC123453180 n=1 Tax=Hordeum vulgare subsp. vulgare TaxID=112509 RepID=UPI001B847E9F|nr:uncharacterized protein LOC123453180 [Hordeum vulgare subsp. vulgare]KAE8777037.1 hypothetical protein D1007_50226 [Hordeum vulgare]